MAWWTNEKHMKLDLELTKGHSTEREPTLPIDCSSYRYLNYEIKKRGPHARLGATAPCSFAIIPCNII